MQQSALVQPSLLANLTYGRMQGQNKGLAMAPTPTLLQPSAVEVVCLSFVFLVWLCRNMGSVGLAPRRTTRPTAQRHGNVTHARGKDF